MKRTRKLKITALILTAAAALFLFGCGARKYHVDYCGLKDFYDGAKDSYSAGEAVKLRYDLIASDMEMTFYVDGESVRPQWENNAFIISFTMPEHDIEIRCEYRPSVTVME